MTTPSDLGKLLLLSVRRSSRLSVAVSWAMRDRRFEELSTSRLTRTRLTTCSALGLFSAVTVPVRRIATV